jgi:hypothetical protein
MLGEMASSRSGTGGLFLNADLLSAAKRNQRELQPTFGFGCADLGYGLAADLDLRDAL